VRLRQGARPGDDAGALADPLVAGVDRADQVVVRHGILAARCADGVDARVLRAGGLLERGHAAAPFSSSTAASRSSGVFTATFGVPRMPRLASPTRAPAGATSMNPVTPAARNESMHRSQRTGEETWVTMRSSASLPSVTTAPSRLDQSVWAGSSGATSAIAARSDSTAGVMYEVWKAPATCRGITLTPRGALSASFARLSRVPAATIWPATL